MMGKAASEYATKMIDHFDYAAETVQGRPMPAQVVPRYAILMEFANGGDLKKYTRTRAPLAWNQAIWVFHDVSVAVSLTQRGWGDISDPNFTKIYSYSMKSSMIVDNCSILFFGEDSRMFNYCEC